MKKSFIGIFVIVIIGIGLGSYYIFRPSDMDTSFKITTSETVDKDGNFRLDWTSIFGVSNYQLIRAMNNITDLMQ